MSPAQIALVVLIGFISSFYGVVSGGGGLITIPGLILIGMPAPQAVASSRIGVLAVGLGGALRFRRAGLIDYARLPSLLVPLLGGAVAGAFLLLRLDADLLRRLIGVATIGVAVVILLGRRLGIEQPDVPPSKLRLRTGYLIAFAIGAYAGLFGAAWATFFTYLMVAAFGMTYLQGAGTRSMAGIPLGIVTVLIFSVGGQIEPAAAIALAISQAAGSYAGASFSLKRGEQYARWLVVVVAVLSGLRLLL